MTITQDYKNAFTEVYTILDHLEDEDYEKIPSDILDVIEENRNKDYEYEMNEEVDIFKQPMLPETKAILFNFFRDYWSTPEQNAKIKRMQREDMQKIEEKKKQEYGSYEIFKNNNPNKNESNTNSDKVKKENASLIEVKKESFITRIINKIKLFFIHKKQ